MRRHELHLHGMAFHRNVMRQATGLKGLCRLPAPPAPVAHTRPVGGSALRSRPRARRCVLAAQLPTSAVQMASPRCAFRHSMCIRSPRNWRHRIRQHVDVDATADECSRVSRSASVKPLPCAAQHVQRTCAAPVWSHGGCRMPSPVCVDPMQQLRNGAPLPQAGQRRHVICRRHQGRNTSGRTGAAARSASGRLRRGCGASARPVQQLAPCALHR